MHPEMIEELEMITSKSQELRMRIRWLEKGLKEIANGRDDINAIYIKQQAQSILDGEPTTADEYNTMQEDEILEYEREHEYRPSLPIQFGGDTGVDADYKYNHEEDVQLGASIVKSNDEVSGVFISDKKIKDVVYMSDINKEIAIDWKNRDREEKIKNKKDTKIYLSECCGAPFPEPGYPDTDLCSQCHEHTEAYLN